MKKDSRPTFPAWVGLRVHKCEAGHVAVVFYRRDPQRLASVKRRQHVPDVVRMQVRVASDDVVPRFVRMLQVHLFEPKQLHKLHVARPSTYMLFLVREQQGSGLGWTLGLVLSKYSVVTVSARANVRFRIKARARIKG